MKTYIFYEISDSCRTEFLMKDGEFHPTEDTIAIGIAEGKDARDTFKNLKQECPYLKTTNSAVLSPEKSAKQFIGN